MVQSLFADLVGTFFPKLQTIIEKINGKKTPPTYLFKQRLRTEYSADQKWESASVNTTYVAADMVALDSPLPLKTRPTLAAASGTLPKIGSKRFMNESQLNTIQIMRAQGQKYEDIVKKLIDDVRLCSSAIDEKNEYNFLYGLSNGVVAFTEDENNTALRISFGYLDENSFGVATAGTLTISDLKKVIEKAELDGNTLTEIWLSKHTYDKLKATREARELVANYNGQTFTPQTSLPVPTSSKFNEAFADDNGGVQFQVVNRSVNIEKNGKAQAVKPWNDNKVIFTVGGELGAVVWGTLAEAANPVPSVIYQTLDQYKLISKYSITDPLREFTAAQALVLPVIENVDQIYVIDITEGESVDTTAEASDTNDTTTTIGDVTYVKSSATSFLGIPATSTDAEVIAAYNNLSRSEKRKFAESVTVSA